MCSISGGLLEIGSKQEANCSSSSSNLAIAASFLRCFSLLRVGNCFLSLDMASSCSSSFFGCVSSTNILSSSSSAPVLRRRRANWLLIEDWCTDNCLFTPKPRSLLLPTEIVKPTKRRCSRARAGPTLQLQNVLHFATALKGDGSLLVDEASAESNGIDGDSERKKILGICSCQVCGRRGLVASLGGLLASTGLTRMASASSFESFDYNAIREAVHPARPTWYEGFYAQAMARTMVSYEAEVAAYKRQLFGNLDKKVEHILEVGIGTGPNLKYYGKLPHLQRVVGVDPNLQMAKYCADSATVAGLSDSQFEFLNAVGEGIPVLDESMDAVVCTLTLCSVSNVTKTLEEVKRILKPGGAFLFVEHVAAPEGTGLRFWQGLLDPLQQWAADGCHLTRNTLQFIDDAQFGSVQSQRFRVASVSLFAPHVMGVAYK